MGSGEERDCVGALLTQIVHFNSAGMERVKQHLFPLGAAVVGKPLESVVLLKSVSSQQWAVLIQTSIFSTAAATQWTDLVKYVSVLTAHSPWRANSICTTILPVRETKHRTTFETSLFRKAKDSPSLSPYVTLAEIMCTKHPHLRADEKSPAIQQCYYVSTGA